MANYTQYTGTGTASPSGTTQGQRWLHNGADYIAVRVGQYDTLYVLGVLEKNNNKVTYSGESWLYNSRDASYTYNDVDSGQITLTDELYVYSDLPGFQRLSVTDVFPHMIFYALFALILVLVGFNLIRKRWLV